MSVKLKIKSGARYGYFKIIEEATPKLMPNGKRSCRRFLCVCKCGKERIVFLSNLRNGGITHCGCKNHGESHTKLYFYWTGIKNRCKPSFKDRKYYYDKGITVCKLWQTSFLSFKKWALENGYKKGLQIDRKRNNKGYSPGNCRFVTPSVNMINRSMTIMCFFEGKRMPAIVAAREHGLTEKECKTVLSRIRNGMDGEMAIKKPIRNSKWVENINTGEIYTSLKKAAKTFGINYSSLSSHLSGLRPLKSITFIKYVD